MRVCEKALFIIRFVLQSANLEIQLFICMCFVCVQCTVLWPLVSALFSVTLFVNEVKLLNKGQRSEAVNDGKYVSN